MISAALLLLAMQADTVNHWTVGSRVRANATVYARADSTAMGTVLGIRAVGDKGTIAGGPIGPVSDGTVRWKINYDTPPSGWSTQKWLTLDSLAMPGAVPASVQVNFLSFTMYLTIPVRLRATVRDAAGVTLAMPVSWSTSNPAVTTVDDTGLVTGHGIGIDTVAAAVNNLRAISVVTVIPAPPTLATAVCGRAPPPVGCGMDQSWWASLGVGRTSGTYGPWFIVDSLGFKRQAVRVVVTDTTP